MIPVTKPFLPDINSYNELISGIWQREYLTNNGPLVRELEQKIRDFLKINNVLFLNNGTIALQIAIKALDLKGEIITTPFSFVATTSSVVWEGCRPVFADIEPGSFNINPEKIEAMINKKTTAILATHCFGNACNIDAIQKIADHYQLKVIYDAAHCFGTTYKGECIFEYGDISTTSFHATKLFHTIEGGAVFSKNEFLIHRMKKMRNFGHDGPDKFSGVGINGKNSEVHAAMGLCILPRMKEILNKRKEQAFCYDQFLRKSPKLSFQQIENYCDYNFAYYPVVFEDENTLLKIVKELEACQISPRRYFYPSLSSLDYVSGYETPVADDISKRILCLPVYHTLKTEEIEKISEIILKNI